MESMHEQIEPYGSLEELRSASDALLEGVPPDPYDHEKDAENIKELIISFINKAIETGKVLDLFSDRRVAQGLVDYWKATSYSLRPGFSKSGNGGSRIKWILEPFDATIMMSAVGKIEHYLAGADVDTVLAARRIMLRLLSLSRTSACFSAQPALITELKTMGPRASGEKALAGLLAAGVLTKLSVDPEKVTLKYDALQRHWRALTEWLADRRRFWDACLLWDRGGRSKDLLLNRKYWIEASTYTDLDKTEREFLNECQYHYRRSLIAYAGTSLVLFTLLLIFVYREYHRWWVNQRVAEVTENVLSKTRDAASKEKGIKWLASRRKPLAFTRAYFGPVTLDGIQTTAPFFPLATFINCTLKSATMPYAIFDDSIINGTDFSSANLRFSRFDRSTIRRSSFESADLYRAEFNDVKLNNVSFVNANVAFASFRMKFEAPEDMPNFTGSAWWLAYGWTSDQVDELSNRYPLYQYLRSPAYFRRIQQAFDAVAESQPGTLTNAEKLNDVAWLYATSGGDLEDAESFVVYAISTLNALEAPISPDSYRRTLANFLDTLGYVLLQRAARQKSPGHPLRDNESLPRSVEVLREARAARPSGETDFRLAVALIATAESDGNPKMRDDAMEMAQNVVRDANYIPSHELLLLRPLLPDKLLNEIAN